MHALHGNGVHGCFMLLLMTMMFLCFQGEQCFGFLPGRLQLPSFDDFFFMAAVHCILSIASFPGRWHSGFAFLSAVILGVWSLGFSPVWPCCSFCTAVWRLSWQKKPKGVRPKQCRKCGKERLVSRRRRVRSCKVSRSFLMLWWLLFTALLFPLPSHFDPASHQWVVANEAAHFHHHVSAPFIFDVKWAMCRKHRNKLLHSLYGNTVSPTTWETSESSQGLQLSHIDELNLPENAVAITLPANQVKWIRGS